jgi:hypothetical protein
VSRNITFVVFHVDMYVCVFVVYVKFQKPNSNGSLVIAIKLKAKHASPTIILLFYIL